MPTISTEQATDATVGAGDKEHWVLSSQMFQDRQWTKVEPWGDSRHCTPPQSRVLTHHRQDLREAFELFDQDGDGRVQAVEMVELLMALGIDASPTEAMDMIAEVDADGSGAVHFAQLAT